MSSEALREAAKAGKHKELLELLRGGANPCSGDVRLCKLQCGVAVSALFAL